MIATSKSDNSMSDLDKAKIILTSKDILVKDLSKLTKIRYQTLVNYRQDLTRLDRASWAIINKLARIYDRFVHPSELPSDTSAELQDKLNELFGTWKKSYTNSPSELKIIDLIQNSVNSDPVILELISANIKKAP